MVAWWLVVASLAGQGDTAPADPHLALNPVYRQLVEQGVAPGLGDAVKLPAPHMADGLDEARQTEVLKQIGAPRFRLHEMLRESASAPHVFEIKREKTPDAQRFLQHVDFYFVAYGEFDLLRDKEFLNTLLQNSDENKGESIADAALQQRGIERGDPEHESFGHIEFNLIDLVRLAASGRSHWSRSEHSILTAAIVDPRFRGDMQYPNRWRHQDKHGKVGEWQTFEGAGLYMRISRLHSPPKALFLECHLVAVEPAAWFGGPNLLGSKLPPVVQDQVRSVRRKLANPPRQ